MKKQYSGKNALGLQALGFCSTIQYVALYWTSADGFPKHLAAAKQLPPILSDQIVTLRESLYTFNYPWQKATFAGIVYGCFFVAIGNQISMPARLAGLFGYDIKKNRKKVIDGLIVFITSQNGTFRALVSGASFLALLSVYINFWPALYVTAFFFPGNILSQFVNYIEPFFQKLGCCALPEFIIKGIAAYAALSKAVYDMALFFNTVDQGLWRMGVLPDRISQSPIVSLRYLGWGLHTPFNLMMGWETLKSYYRRIHKLLSQSQFGGNLDIQEEEPLLSDEQPKEAVAQKEYSLYDRVSLKGSIAAIYRSSASSLSVLDIFSPIIDYAKLGVIPLLMYVLALFLLIVNFPAQLSFFRYTNEDLTRMKIEPGRGWCARLFGSQKIENLNKPSNQSLSKCQFC